MIPVLHSVSYAGLWGQDALGLEAFIEKAAALGYQGVMLMAKRPHLSALDLDGRRLDALAGLLERKGLQAACIAGYSDPNAGWSVKGGPFAPLGEAQLVCVKHWTRMAKRLKAPVIRLLTGPAGTGEPYTAQWRRCVDFIRGACDIAGEEGIAIGVQNHDDIACHYLSMLDFIEETGRPNCKACFDAWTPALHGDDLAGAARAMAPLTVHTTAADYVRRPRYRYHPPGDGNVFERVLDEVRAVPMGEGIVDYATFFNALREGGFGGTVGYEMCSPIRGGGGMDNLDRYAKTFLEYMKPWTQTARGETP